MTFTIDLPGETEGAPARAIFERALQAISNLPGVQSTALGGTFRRTHCNGVITIEGQAHQDAEPFMGWDVSPGYFRTIGIPLRRGRLFTSTETSGTVISESMARRFWPGQDALGKRFKTSLPGLDPGNWYTVLGVVADRLSNGPGSTVLPMMYKLAPGWITTTFIVRTSANPQSLIAPVRLAVRGVSPVVPHFDIETVEQQLSEIEAPRRFETTLLNIFALLATLLAAAGFYGLLQHAVAQRTKEIGIRLALGAHRADIVRLVLSYGLRGVALGLIGGVVASYVATRVLASVLYGVTATDPITFGGVVLLLIWVAVAASSMPAWRAVKVDPMVTLRHE